MSKQKKYKITKEQIHTGQRKISREIEMERNGKWTATHKIHKSDKTYSRNKFKNEGFLEHRY
jgi:hypothetical protein